MTDPDAPRLVLIVNPQSGKGRGAHAGAQAEQLLRDAGVEVIVLRGSTAAHARSLTEQAVQQHPDGVVVVGGDGTVTGIADLLADTGLPTTLVPAGTGDDLARALGIPADDARAAASAALHGRPRRIDLGTIESQGVRGSFLTVAALGFDARVSERTNALRHPRGRARYHLALLIELVRLRPTDFQVQIDDEAGERRPGTLLAVGSTSSYGGGMPICIGAEPDDGQLRVVHVAPLGRLRLIRLFPLLLRGAHLARREVTVRQATRVHVSAPDLIVYADGERVGTGECTIGIRPGAVTIMMPEGRADGI